MKTLKKLHAKVRKWVAGRPRRQPHSFRPGMELLEERRVLSPVAGTPAAVTYNNGLYAFVRETDGHLHVAVTTGANSSWEDVGKPAANVTVAGDPSAVVYSPNNTMGVFVRGSDGHLWDAYSYNGTTWNWADLTALPGGVTVAGDPSAVLYSPNKSLGVFVRGSNGHLYDAYYCYNGTTWNWADQGAPAAGVTVTSAPSAVQYGSSSLDVFVQGSDGHLYVNYFGGVGWGWADQGTPISGVTIAGAPSAVAYGNNGLYAFTRGSDGELYDNFYFPASGWKWETHGALHPDAAMPYSPVSGNLFNSSGSASYQDVQQGAEGDCWLMASLAETAARAPADITNMFTKDGTILENGATVTVYTARFYDSAGVARYVTVDTELPMNSNGTCTYDQPVNGALWAALAEKAYAEANGAGYVTARIANSDAYDALGNTPDANGNTGGYPSWALQAITGKSAGYTPLSPSGLTTDWLNGNLLVLGTNATTTAINSVNIVSGHAYAVVGYDPSTQLFTLFNPWGVKGGYQLVNGNYVFCAGTVTATGAQLTADFGWEFYGSGAAQSGRDGHHAASPQARADLAFIANLLDAHSKTRRGGAALLPDVAGV